MNPELETNRLLLIDSSSQRLCVSVFDADGKIATRVSREDASLVLFSSIAELLSEISLKLGELKAIGFCAGPGSMLGLRTAAMGIRAWQATGILEAVSTYSFTSLQIGAELARLQEKGDNDFLLVTDARRNSWSAVERKNGCNGEARLISHESLEAYSGRIYTLSDFPKWAQPSRTLTQIPYLPEKIFSESGFVSLLQPAPEIELLSLRATEFAKWIPKARTSDNLTP
jgi:tRNA threonylcarbamoyladenosine biosynthesis protein TsaB